MAKETTTTTLIQPALEPFEGIAARRKTPDWLLAATKAGQRWAIGHLVTEEQFDDAVKKTGGLKFSNPK